MALRRTIDLYTEAQRQAEANREGKGTEMSASMHTSRWLVKRVEEHGELTSTIELLETEAKEIYSNWCNNIRRFNDQSVSLVRVTHTETLISTKINTEFKTVE